MDNVSRLPVCRECLASIGRIAEAVCCVCGERLLSVYPQAGETEQRCGECQQSEWPFARAVAYGSYEGGLRDLIHLLKYQQVRPAADVLGRMLAEAIADIVPAFGKQAPLLTPVPLHVVKLRQRGFNQSELIARAAVRILSRTHFSFAEVGHPATEVLVRKRATESQTGLTRHQRRENMRGAFVVANAEAIAGRDVLLVDDVFTTGTTVSECARVLRRAGAERVWVATVD